LEVANILELDVRKGRQPGAFRDRTLADLASLPIKIDPDTDFWAWSATLQLAARHRLTLYDAAYLELAVRLEVPLATLDQELSQAGVRENLIILGN
jgi:predicted nucleic acid-binding protein